MKSPFGILNIWPWAMSELTVMEEMGRASIFEGFLVDEDVIRAEVGLASVLDWAAKPELGSFCFKLLSFLVELLVLLVVSFYSCDEVFCIDDVDALFSSVTLVADLGIVTWINMFSLSRPS